VTPETETVLLALAAAFLTASTNVVCSRALARMGSFALAQVTNLGNVTLLGAYGLWGFDSGRLRWEALAWFAALGVLNFSINRWVFYTGMSAMGPSRHIAVMGLAPLPSLALAMALLGERPGGLVLLGTVLIVAGVVAVSYERAQGRWVRAGIGWSLTSVLFLAASAYMRNRGMNVMREPALLTAWAALVAIPTGELLRPLLPRRYFAWGPIGALAPVLLLSMVLNCVQQVLINQSIQGKLSLAVPIMSASPVFVLVLSAAFLRDLERLNARVVAGVLLAVAGMAAIGAGRHG